MEIHDSRRLTGPNILWDRPGAVIDVSATDDEITAWEANARRLLTELGWEPATAIRRSASGASLAIAAPIDCLYAATEVNEAAARSDLDSSWEEVVAARRVSIDDEANPALMALATDAARRDVPFLMGDDLVTLGRGRRSVTFPDRQIPDDIAWDQIGTVPTAVITGTNGKTTTVRLVAAMAAEAGLVAGYSSTDGVFVGGELVERGDYSGPEGARHVLRSPIDVAILETARGGLLRRGVAVERADVALITNVAEDHLGEFGVDDLAGVAETKLVVARAVAHSGILVLNSADPLLAAAELSQPIEWFDGGSNAPIAVDGAAAVEVADIPITVGGAAAHNVANARAAVAVAQHLGIPAAAIEAGLRAFDDNPGRANVLSVGGVTVVVDYAHNPAGVSALFAMAQAMPAKRRIASIGQAGDRDDDSIRQLARIAHAAGTDVFVVKELPTHLRGRQLGEIPALLIDELETLGAADIRRADDELDAVSVALDAAAPGDLVLLTVHSRRDEVMDLISSRA